MNATQIEELMFRLSMCEQAGRTADSFDNNIRKLKKYLEAHPGSFELYFASVNLFKPEGLGKLLVGDDFGTSLKVEIGFSTFCTECKETHFMTFTALSMKMAEDEAAFVLAKKLEEILHG